MIWLLRHGDAEDGSPDSARELTGKGKKQSRVAGAALKALDEGIEGCLTSPKVRARQTAELACEPLGVKPESDDRLAGGGFDAVGLAEGRGNVLLVGHEPDFSTVIAELTGARVRMRKGGLAAIEDGVLHALLRPADLRTISKS
jgi:phosphohistidine phosphatase